MFPEHRDLIQKLRQEDAHFARLFEEHNELDHKIKAIESNIEIGTPEEVETLKKEKLLLKDKLYAIIKEADGK
ncbi:YdcH family protein [Pasteurellaceae bacterium TAE3-ERU1]|uniref:YdcH family protein n=1 Tax=Spirabiliibacterium TaxID=2820724 RepID=UPI001AAD566F|nr:MULTISPECIES: YdcH family protein [Spirabiliibacterium]MBE2896092.1 YdcH family protein [Spirabiliibacterium pneumoniae]MBE2897367.1 YdcH family protein [Spirabiliibacterium mucosae]MBV7388614.1 YdcH family protein [Pasteurellaceae bacterium TAE3-ERU1]